MIFIPNSSKEGDSTSKGPTKNFSGDVWLDLLHNDKENTIANVTFTPCARTNWHTHAGGQLVRVLAGSGWICDRGETPRRLRCGDTVWCPPGTEHWHGADDGTYMTHFVHAHGSVVSFLKQFPRQASRISADPWPFFPSGLARARVKRGVCEEECLMPLRCIASRISHKQGDAQKLLLSDVVTCAPPQLWPHDFQIQSRSLPYYLPLSPTVMALLV